MSGARLAAALADRDVIERDLGQGGNGDGVSGRKPELAAVIGADNF